MCLCLSQCVSLRVSMGKVGRGWLCMQALRESSRGRKKASPTERACSGKIGDGVELRVSRNANARQIFYSPRPATQWTRPSSVNQPTAPARSASAATKRERPSFRKLFWTPDREERDFLHLLSSAPGGAAAHVVALIPASRRRRSGSGPAEAGDRERGPSPARRVALAAGARRPLVRSCVAQAPVCRGLGASGSWG